APVVRPEPLPAVQPLRREPPPLFPPVVAEADPRAEARRQVAQGRIAFAAQEYGRAARRFGQATEADPQDGLAWFLLTQAQFALGKYAEAVQALHAGLRRLPDGPAEFRPREMYGANLDDFFRQLRLLEDATRDNPEDPVLLLLRGWQLWTD